MTGTSAPGESVRVVELQTSLRDDQLRELRAGDVVYLSGPVLTARDGAHRYMLDEDHEPPIAIRDAVNVSLQSSPAGVQVTPGQFELASLQATAGFRYGRSMKPLLELGVRAVVGKGGITPELSQDVLREYGAVCLSTMPYGTGALFGRAVERVREVHWLDPLGISEAMGVLELNRLGPLLVEGDTLGNSFFVEHDSEIVEPLEAAYSGLPRPILSRRGELDDATQELI